MTQLTTAMFGRGGGEARRGKGAFGSLSKILVERIAQEKQRYSTCGDWEFLDDGPNGAETLRVRVSMMHDFRSEVAVALHEAVEALLCRAAGISGAEADRFDISGPGAQLDDPGNDPRAPYHIQHMWSTIIERMAVKAMGLSWEQHDDYVGSPLLGDRPGAGVIFELNLPENRP
jgi:hypothetical protein